MIQDYFCDTCDGFRAEKEYLAGGYRLHICGHCAASKELPDFAVAALKRKLAYHERGANKAEMCGDYPLMNKHQEEAWDLEDAIQKVGG